MRPRSDGLPPRWFTAIEVAQRPRLVFGCQWLRRTRGMLTTASITRRRLGERAPGTACETVPPPDGGQCSKPDGETRGTLRTHAARSSGVRPDDATSTTHSFSEMQHRAHRRPAQPPDERALGPARCLCERLDRREGEPQYRSNVPAAPRDRADAPRASVAEVRQSPLDATGLRSTEVRCGER